MNPPLDSAPIVRGDFDMRRVDTIAMTQMAVQRTGAYWLGGGRMAGITLLNPLPAGDEWTVLTDGTVALVRSHDYHIDWIHPDGTVTSTPKMPFDWKPISREVKQHLLDSLVQRADSFAAHPPDGEKPWKSAAPFKAVDVNDLPDFYPPIRPGQVKSDPDGNVWILPSTSTLSSASTPGLVYDVVNRNGEIFERVRLPEGRNLAAAGPHGVVYMTHVSYVTGHLFARLERATIIR